ncbi:MAG: macro domain-containing protein, partial [Bacteroidia bacterium]
MIRYTTGDIFDAKTEAIINTVNTVGVMGKGIALQFKKRFPANFEQYRQACDAKNFHIGDLLITENNSLFFKYIINFPTKKHWRNPSQYSFIEAGLKALLEKVQELQIQSVAIPPLGAGNGKLEWEKVKSLIHTYLSQAPEVEWVIYEPQARFEQRDNSKKKQANLTPVRAMLLRAFADYEQVDASLNLLVSQKLAYFLQRFGEPLRLNYQKGWYGPYAPVLNKVLQAMNGIYIDYHAGKDKPDT